MAPNALAVAAHPDDIEFLMAGTLMRLADAGYALHYLNVADGCCGSSVQGPIETARVRRAEAINAAQLLGATYHESLCHDIEIFYDRPTLARLTSIMRLVSPSIVLTHAPADYMEDHMNACRLAVTAAFCRGMPNFPVEPHREATGQPVRVYHAQPYSNREPLGQIVHPDLFVDVSDLIDRKRSLLACHASQKAWLDESQGVDSYLHAMETLDREVGEMSGCFASAEGWRRHLHLGFCDPEFDPLVQSIGAHTSESRHE